MRTSKYLENAIRRATPEVVLEEFTRQTFDVYYHWVQSEQLVFGQEGDDHFSDLAALYSLGEFLNDKPFKDAIIEATAGWIWSHERFSKEPLDICYWGKVSGKMRNLYIRQLVTTATIETVEDWLYPDDPELKLPRSFAIALAFEFAQVFFDREFYYFPTADDCGEFK